MVLVLLDRDVFRYPPNSFRGYPFWSINDYLDPDVCAQEMEKIIDAGFGGAFFHAREGLRMGFLGREWFECFRSSLNKAKERNGYLWIYDEDRWPSGFGGGMVSALGPRYRSKALYMIPGYIPFSGEDVIATFVCKTDEKGLVISCKKALDRDEGHGNLYLTFVKYTASIGDAWFSGYSYVDLLDPDVVRKFIELAYEPYAKLAGEEFGKSIPGIFTDEPNFSASRKSFYWPSEHLIPPRGYGFPISAIPWTDKLPEIFRKMNGYDIIDVLPELFFDIGNYRKTRYDFWKTITKLFVNSFSRQIYEWCDKHRLKFTGHYLNEDSLLQLTDVGAVMPHYEYQHIPGIDQLGFPKNLKDFECCGNILTVKQVASIANQLGKERVLCEAYGTTGNYPSFADRKWIGDYLYVLGVNLLNHHLVPASMKGRRKRDYGLNFHWSQPWWKYNRVIEDYFARLSYVLSQGMRVVDILVIHPISSAWILYSPLNQSNVRDLDKRFKELLKNLLELHLDFELGDEMIIEKYGSVEKNLFRIGRAKYSIVILPPSINISSSTLKLLKHFVENGGKLIAIKPLPELVDGSKCDEVKKILEKAVIIENTSKSELMKIANIFDRRIVIEGDDDGNIFYHLRDTGEELILFLTNVSREKLYEVNIGVKGEYSIEEWNPFTGDVEKYSGYIEKGMTWFKVKLHPIGSALFVLKPGRPISKKEKMLKLVNKLDISSGWYVKRRNPNVLVIDYARYYDGGWSDLIPIWKVHDAIVRRGFGSRYTIRYEFYSEIELRGREIFLVIENIDGLIGVRVNGFNIDSSRIAGYWIDNNFILYRISDIVSQGLNVVEVDGVVSYDTEIENIYIVGDFGVRIESDKPIITHESNYVDEVSDLTKKFYPFYSGEIELRKEINIDKDNKRVMLRVSKLNAALALIYINNEFVGYLISPPYELDITKYVRNGLNEISIVIVGTLRNTLGPLHHLKGDPQWIGPETFRDERMWIDRYMLKPFGIDGIEIDIYKELE